MEQARAVRALIDLPTKEDDNMSGAASDTSSSGVEQIRFDPYVIFESYYRNKEDKGKGGHR